MEYFTAVDKLVLFGIAAGLFGGLLNSAVEIALKRWNKETLVSQRELVTRSLLRSVIWAIMYGAGAFVLVLYDTATTLPALRQLLIFFVASIGLGEPFFNRAWDWLIDRYNT